MNAAVDNSAHQLLEVVLLVMRTIRGEMRRHRTSDLSVPQFRTLACVHRRPVVSLSPVAEHIGLTLPSMRKLIDGLVAHGLITRESSAEDRRRITLAITARGRTMLDTARGAALSSLAERLQHLTESERTTVIRGMQTLHRVFASIPEGGTLRDLAAAV